MQDHNERAKRQKGKRRSVQDRLLDKIEIDQNGCWLWTASVTRSGYAQLRDGTGKQTSAHRVSYEEFIGPIPKGLHIDHLCQVRHCVNPDHLEAVSPRENTLRSEKTIASRWLNRTHCEHGHEFTPENTRLVWRRETQTAPARLCRECVRERSRLRAAERRAEAKAARTAGGEDK